MLHETTLKNGLRILTFTMSQTRAVSVSFFVGTGSRYESDDAAELPSNDILLDGLTLDDADDVDWFSWYPTVTGLLELDLFIETLGSDLNLAVQFSKFFFGVFTKLNPPSQVPAPFPLK